MSKMDEEVTILLVEDDPGHARLVEKNFRRACIKNKIITFGDGQKIINFLQSGQAGSAPLLVLLDLNLPILDGYRVLEQIKGNDSTRHIPVVVLTTTDDPREIARSYQLGCNAYINKPVDYTKIAEVLAKLGLFLSIVSTPNHR
jgi:CheY-like chemotaxis protein